MISKSGAFGQGASWAGNFIPGPLVSIGRPRACKLSHAFRRLAGHVIGDPRTAVPTAVIDSPLGPIRLECFEGALTRVWLPGEGTRRWRRDAATAADGITAPDDIRDEALAETARQLTEYFAGTRTGFTLRLAPHGTPFQRQVWDALLTIPYGATWSYAQVARAIGRPDAVRAVGLANGANPLAIVVPCHRVIGSDGRLTGYGGGLPAKRYLLDFERSVLAGQPGAFVLS
ncbi:MAG: methylated-DNA--[protein]-cysteine S-methyltransferase [Vicinamibacteraceae bacterium]|nr:methylated-DNA--[protein]-cysteine S-methyltransferase [Vicinamibacteraceae bacterium]